MKTSLGRLNVLYPTPTTLVGAMVDGRPNFITIAYVGIMEHTHLSIGMNKNHYTNAGIKASGVFSICFPSEDLVVQTDYCGLVSGRDTDKESLFDLFYGELGNAPMIEQCPVCIECRLDRTIDFPSHEVFVGEIVQTFADEAVLRDGKIDLALVRPLLFDMTSRQYWSLGQPVAPCWKIGRQLRQGRTDQG